MPVNCLVATAIIIYLGTAYTENKRGRCVFKYLRTAYILIFGLPFDHAMRNGFVCHISIQSCNTQGPTVKISSKRKQFGALEVLKLLFDLSDTRS